MKKTYISILVILCLCVGKTVSVTIEDLCNTVTFIQTCNCETFPDMCNLLNSTGGSVTKEQVCRALKAPDALCDCALAPDLCKLLINSVSTTTAATTTTSKTTTTTTPEITPPPPPTTTTTDVPTTTPEATTTSTTKVNLTCTGDECSGSSTLSFSKVMITFTFLTTVMILLAY